MNHGQLFKEKQLDNLTIGITDMMGNVYHYNDLCDVRAGNTHYLHVASTGGGMLIKLVIT